MHTPPLSEASIASPGPNSIPLSAHMSPPLIRALTLDFYCCMVPVLSHPPSATTPFSCKFINCNCRSHNPTVLLSNSRTPSYCVPLSIVVCSLTQRFGIDASLHNSASALMIHIFFQMPRGLQRRRYAWTCPLRRSPSLPARSDGVGDGRPCLSAPTGSPRSRRRRQRCECTMM